ncbi:MAG: hypothetical protein M0R80_01960 [Proteobacteria bacterium]|jgi:hypothetical protein|nr:hypothetical protein [Pseudomonadota bacterium]
MDNENIEVKRPSEFALEIAATAWCKPATEMKAMDPTLATAFAEIVDEIISVERCVSKDTVKHQKRLILMLEDKVKTLRQQTWIDEATICGLLQELADERAQNQMEYIVNKIDEYLDEYREIYGKSISGKEVMNHVAHEIVGFEYLHRLTSLMSMDEMPHFSYTTEDE